MRRGLFLAGPILLAHCAVLPQPLALPDDGQATVAVFSQALPHSMGGIARHSWIVTRRKGEREFVRHEVLGSANAHHGDPFEPQCCAGDGVEGADVRRHAVVHGASAEAIIPCIDRETKIYNREHSYGFWPGANCNTYVAIMARKCGISVELPSTANGRDYRGIVGAGVTSGGTGVQLETPLVGLKLGLKEGVEVHVFGGAIGVDFWPPAIIVPIGPGRIGFDDRSSLAGSHGPMLRPKASSSAQGTNDGGNGEPPSYIGDATVFARTEGGGGETANDAARAAGLAPTFLLSGAADVRGMLALVGRFGPAFGLDFELGFAAPAGFVHGLRLEPLGLGISLGRMGFFTATTGAGFGGITGHGPTALEIPASARLALDASSNVRLLLDARVLWAFARARQDGAPDAPFGDEMRLGAGVRIGQMWSEHQFADGGGYFFRLEHAERLGATYVGAALGWELGAGL